MSCDKVGGGFAWYRDGILREKVNFLNTGCGSRMEESKCERYASWKWRLKFQVQLSNKAMTISFYNKLSNLFPKDVVTAFAFDGCEQILIGHLESKLYFVDFRGCG